MTDQTPAERVRAFVDAWHDPAHPQGSISTQRVASRDEALRLTADDLRALLDERDQLAADLEAVRGVLDQIEQMALDEERQGYAIAYCALWDAHGRLSDVLDPAAGTQARQDGPQPHAPGTQAPSRQPETSHTSSTPQRPAQALHHGAPQWTTENYPPIEPHILDGYRNALLQPPGIAHSAYYQIAYRLLREVERLEQELASAYTEDEDAHLTLRDIDPGYVHDCEEADRIADKFDERTGDDEKAPF
jgi:hypothetical protein